LDLILAVNKKINISPNSEYSLSEEFNNLNLTANSKGNYKIYANFESNRFVFESSYEFDVV